MHTLQHEDQLPKLPLPSLQSTASQALQALQPLVSSEEYNHLKTQASKFTSSISIKALQSHLERAAEVNANYLNAEGISQTTGNVYGDLRGGTLPRNPFFILEDDPLKNYAPTQEFRAAVLTISSLRFLLALKQGKLKPDVNSRTNEPFTMSGYSNLFATTVIPQENGVNVKSTQDSKHIVIMSRGLFYSLTVLSFDDKIWFTKHEMKAIMKDIIRDSFRRSTAIGVFTTESKANWKLARQRLELTNPDAMETIDTALFVVCLDHETPQSDLEKIQFIAHGTSKIDLNGIQVGTCINRYYDKLNLIITKNSVAACIYPASIIDGTAALRYISDIYTDSVLRLARMIGGKNYTLWTDIDTVPISKDIEKPTSAPINFNLSSDVTNGLHLAESRLADLILQHEYICKKMPNFGKAYIKDKMNLPVDSFVQICVQITYYALYGKVPSTFEPVSTRRFKDARTEPICVQNMDTLNICQKFISQVSDQEKWQTFYHSVQNHKDSVKNASNGLGFERHLSALRSAFIQRHELYKLNPDLPQTKSIPPLLFDPLVDLIYKPELLVANCGNPALDFFGITPSLPTGYGIGYIIKDDSITFVGSSQWRQTGRFLDTLEHVFSEMKRIWKGVLCSPQLDQRTDELQTYIDSIPMAMIQSNNSKLKPVLNNPVPSKLFKGDGFILGGYDYFDVDQVNIRSGKQTTAQSRALTREQSCADLSSLFVGNVKTIVNKLNVGRKVAIEQEL